MLQPIEKMWSKYGVDHPRSKKCRNIWQAQYKMRGVISARFKNTLLFYGGLELLHGQFKQEETHADTPGVKSLRGWRGWTPSLHSWVLLQLLKCRQHSAWQEGWMQGIVFR